MEAILEFIDTSGDRIGYIAVLQTLDIKHSLPFLFAVGVALISLIAHHVRTHKAKTK